MSSFICNGSLAGGGTHQRTFFGRPLAVRPALLVPKPEAGHLILPASATATNWYSGTDKIATAPDFHQYTRRKTHQHLPHGQVPKILTLQWLLL